MHVHGMSQAEAERAAARQTITYVMKENFTEPERSVDMPWDWIIGGTIFLTAAVIITCFYLMDYLDEALGTLGNSN
jgi:hypothetical protein